MSDSRIQSPPEKPRVPPKDPRVGDPRFRSPSENTRVPLEDPRVRSPPKATVRPPLEDPRIRAPSEKVRVPPEDHRLGDPRIRSPPEKIRVPLRSDWHSDPYLSPDDYAQEKRPLQSLRSLSPTELIRSQRIMDGYRQGGSNERGKYNRRIYDGRVEDDRSPSPRFGKWSHVDEEVSFREEHIPREAFTDARGKYVVPEYEDSYDGLNPKLKHFGGSGSSGLRYDQVKHNQGTERSWHMPPKVVGHTLNSGRRGGALVSSSAGNPNIRLREGEDMRFQEKLHSDKVSMEEYYEEEYDHLSYAEDAYDPALVSSHPREFRRLPAEVPKDRLRVISKDYLPSYGVGRRRTNYDLEDQDGYSEGPPHFAKEPEIHLNDRTVHNYETPARREPREYGHYDNVRREEDRIGVRAELYREDEPNERRAYIRRGSFRPRLPDSVVDEVIYVKRSSTNYRESNSRVHHPLQEERLSNYQSIKSGPLTADHDIEFSGSGISTFGIKPSRESERNRSIGGDYGFGRDAGPLSHKERLKRMQVSESDPSMYRQSVSPRRRLKTEEYSAYEPSERMQKRRYPIDQEMSRHTDRSILLSDRITSRQVQELNSNEEQWIDEKAGGLFSSKRLRLSQLPYRKSGRPYEGRIIGRVSESDDWSSYSDAPEDVQISADDHYTNADGMNIKERLRHYRPNYHNSYTMGRRQDFYKSDRTWKRNTDNENDVMPTDDGNLYEDMDAPNHDLPEDSDEFKQQVENLFLQYCKVLNNKPSTQRRYREEGNAGFLLCIVCGRDSKDFQDTRSLVTHTFMSRKLGKRAHHLALNKAICVLMGWKSIIIPTGACVYEALPQPEAAALKEDLILWPPFVIIHNSSVLNGNPEPLVISVEQVEAILRGMGFSGGKMKVRYGKSANQSIILVKFLPTFSGLQEAEKLHNYYIENKREREEFNKLKVKRNMGSEEAGEKPEVIVENLLYGYLAIAEDLDKLDFDSKKKCVVKSKKDIQAIADAPLKSD